MKLFIVLTTLCFVLKVCVLVQGLYLVQVRLNGYSNPTGKCGDDRLCRTSSRQRRCCDSHGTTNCGQYCDSYFIYCLRPLGERRPVDSPRCFSNETRAESSPNRNDNRSLDFSQSTVLDLDNPQNLSGLGDAYQGVQIYIEVKDQDSNDDDLIDLILINHNLTIARSLQQNHIGIYTFVTMNLTITVFCERNFQGSDCTECVPGFTGANCNERVDRSSGNQVNVGAITGGVVGTSLAVVIVLIPVVVILVIILKHRNNDVNNQGIKSWTGSSGAVAGDNPVYGEPGNTVKGDSPSQTTAAVTTSYEREGLESSMGERKFDNPIYGDDETDAYVYTAPFDQQDQQSQANHEFDNPVYGTETYS